MCVEHVIGFSLQGNVEPPGRCVFTGDEIALRFCKDRTDSGMQKDEDKKRMMGKPTQRL